jgi:hypothetical protein
VSVRYQTALLPPDEKGRVMWGIRDLANGGRWVETGGEVERFPIEDGAIGWIRRQTYLNETATYRA